MKKKTRKLLIAGGVTFVVWRVVVGVRGATAAAEAAGEAIPFQQSGGAVRPPHADASRLRRAAAASGRSMTGNIGGSSGHTLVGKIG